MATLNAPILAVASYNNIFPSIQVGALRYPSYVLCKDNWTWAFVDKDGTVQRIKGYQQDNIIFVDALPTEDIRTNVFYIYNGAGYLYVDSDFVPVFNLNGDSASYDDLNNVPIINKYGEVSSPIVLSDLDNGAYSITGQYMIGGNLSTIFVVPHNVLFLIDADNEYKYITKIDAKKVNMYKINAITMEVEEDAYATESWVKAQGYTTEKYVNQAISDLYNRVASELIITKMSQLENDMGYITREELKGIGSTDIASLF